MRRAPLMLILLGALAFPSALAAQEDDDEPETLRLSFFMCDTNRLDEALAEAESRVIPVWKDLVNEGMVESYGYFVHRWADEWNVGIYTIGESIDAVIKASEEAGRRLQERYGDTPSTFGEACPHHRDGFYAFGPGTGDDEEDEDDEGGS